MSERKARGVGLATVSETGQTLDVWYPRPYLGDQPDESDAQLIEKLSQIEGRDDGRGVNRTATVVTIDLDESARSTADAYLRLHLLSHRLVKPNTINLDGLFAVSYTHLRAHETS